MGKSFLFIFCLHLLGGSQHSNGVLKVWIRGSLWFQMPKVIVLKKPNVVVHASSPGAQEAEVGGLLEFTS
jgi:hypothetical protein